MALRGQCDCLICVNIQICATSVFVIDQAVSKCLPVKTQEFICYELVCVSNLKAWTEFYFLEHKDILAMQILTPKGKRKLTTS